MSNQSEFELFAAGLAQRLSGGGGKKLKYQAFASSGTFSPSSTLLTNGGEVFLDMIAGGGSGGQADGTQNFGSGGASGQRIVMPTTVSGATTVTIGAGGAGVNAGTAGNPGGNTSFGSITATGGLGGVNVPSHAMFDGTAGQFNLKGGDGGDGRLRGGKGASFYTGGPTSAPANSGAGGGGSNYSIGASGAGGSGYVVVWWFE